MGKGRGLTVVDLVAAVTVLALAASLLLGGAERPLTPFQQRELRNRIRCRNNLNMVAKGMATYLNEYGDNRFYPCPLGRGIDPKDYNGAEWLASLYWTKVIPKPDILLCPSTKDTNHKGRDLGTFRAPAKRFGTATVSYAGMHYRSLTNAAGKRVAAAIRDDFPPNMPMGSDDTQGSVNHGPKDGGGMCVLFFDSHVEFRTHKEVDLVKGVGRTRRLLSQLRN